MLPSLVLSMNLTHSIHYAIFFMFIILLLPSPLPTRGAGVEWWAGVCSHTGHPQPAGWQQRRERRPQRIWRGTVKKKKGIDLNLCFCVCLLTRERVRGGGDCRKQCPSFSSIFSVGWLACKLWPHSQLHRNTCNGINFRESCPQKLLSILLFVHRYDCTNILVWWLLWPDL